MKWAKWLPYWLVMRITRNQHSQDGQGTLKLSEEYLVTYYQMDEGEFVVYSQDIQNIFDERKESKRKQKMNKKLNKLHKTLNDDYMLRKQLKEDLADEELCG